MKKTLVVLALSSTLLLSACGNSNEEQSSTAEGTTSENQISEASESEKESQSETTNNEQKEQSEFINEAFHTLLDYDNTTYNDRSEAITQYFTGETLQALTGNEHLETDTTFTSTSDNYELYQAVGNEDTNFIMVLDTSFQVEDNPTTDITNIYEFELIEQDGQYRINALQATPKQQPTMITE